ncbi:hypothetical protein ACS0TY_024731 [Phlomoides rotata]
MASSIMARYRFTTNSASRTYDACILGQNIDATVTTINAIVDDYLTSVKSPHQGSPYCVIVGFDTELITTEDHLGLNTVHLIATINFCIGRRILIYHLPYLPYNVLDPFLSDPNNIFVGLDMKAKMEKLDAVYGIGGKARYIDLGEFAAERYNRPELKDASLRGLSNTVLGKDICQPEVGTEWEKDLLSPTQVLHACVHTFVPHELGHALLGQTLRGN